MRKLFPLFFFFGIQHYCIAQISLVKEFISGYTRFEPLNTLVLFNGANGIWKSDGTTVGTTILTTSIRFDENFRSRERVGNVIFFANQATTQLWKTDGTATGTVMVKDLGGFNAPG